MGQLFELGGAPFAFGFFKGCGRWLLTPIAGAPGAWFAPGVLDLALCLFVLPPPAPL